MCSSDLRSYEVFAVIFLDAQNRLLCMEEMFRGTLTQLSVALLRKYFDWLQHKLAVPFSHTCFNLR